MQKSSPDGVQGLTTFARDIAIALAIGAVVALLVALVIRGGADEFEATNRMTLTTEVNWPFYDSVREAQAVAVDEAMIDRVNDRFDDEVRSVEVQIPRNQAFIDVQAVASSAASAAGAANDVAERLIDANVAKVREDTQTELDAARAALASVTPSSTAEDDSRADALVRNIVDLELALAQIEPEIEALRPAQVPDGPRGGAWRDGLLAGLIAGFASLLLVRSISGVGASVGQRRRSTEVSLPPPRSEPNGAAETAPAAPVTRTDDGLERARRKAEDSRRAAAANRPTPSPTAREREVGSGPGSRQPQQARSKPNQSKRSSSASRSTAPTGDPRSGGPRKATSTGPEKKRSPTAKSSTGKKSAAKASTGKTSTGKTSAGKTSTGKASAGKTSAGKTSAGKTSTGKTSTGKASTAKSSTDKRSTGTRASRSGSTTKSGSTAKKGATKPRRPSDEADPDEPSLLDKSRQRRR